MAYKEKEIEKIYLLYRWSSEQFNVAPSLIRLLGIWIWAYPAQKKQERHIDSLPRDIENVRTIYHLVKQKVLRAGRKRDAAHDTSAVKDKNGIYDAFRKIRQFLVGGQGQAQ